jgi:hypothetical protein
VSVDLEQDDKKSKWAMGCGGAMTVAFLIAGIALSVLPFFVHAPFGGRPLGLPFTAAGSFFLAGFGLIIAGIGWLAYKRGRRGRAPVKPWREPPGPPRREPA